MAALSHSAKAHGLQLLSTALAWAQEANTLDFEFPHPIEAHLLERCLFLVLLLLLKNICIYLFVGVVGLSCPMLFLAAVHRLSCSGSMWEFCYLSRD